ncbi:CPBP family intramembrane glutamic endopeptidase [Solicola sp. PLA-1-18]|uniref:CPBP family intramembrane glutamic endopeptidase n=1 Tax=Solicola sp. PLA-1-18 TaxID=3380532 RepID=UPI003B803D94
MTSETTSPTASTRRRLGIEVWIVLGLSLGQSGVYALVSLVAKLTQGPLRDQTATLNASRSSREYLDLTYQLLGIGFALVPVVLALFLLWTGGDRVRDVLGLGRGGTGRAVLEGAGLAALIGLPGLALYFVGRAIGITATVVPSGLDAYWWTVPVLVVAAAQNAVLEEVVVVGYLMTRLRQIGWSPAATIVTSALVRGSYHLYQGIGAGLGNVVMGLVFGWFYHRFGRVLPLVVAHTILDVVAFVGYALLKDVLGLP